MTSLIETPKGILVMISIEGGRLEKPSIGGTMKGKQKSVRG
jgi:hypothetical protein